MCIPMTIPLILSLAATGIGGALNYMGAQQSQNARESAFNAEQRRQKGFDKEQAGRFQDSLGETATLLDPNDQRKHVAAREGALADAIVSAAPDKGGYLPGSSSAPAIVNAAAEKAGAASDARSMGLARALATLGGQTDAMLKNDINIHRNSGIIDQIGGFKRNSINVLDQEMIDASHKGDKLKSLGSFVQALGSAASMGMGGIPGGGGFGNPSIPNFSLAL
jgi:hypothetical protein